MDPLTGNNIPKSNDELARGNNDHLYYASDLKEVNDPILAGKFGKKRKAASLFKAKSDEHLFNSTKIVNAVSTIAASIPTVAVAATVLVVTGTVVVAGINEPRFNIEAETNQVITTQVDYEITAENTDDFTNVSYTVDFAAVSAPTTIINIVPKTDINSATLKNSIDMSAYSTGDLFFKVSNLTETLKEYTYRYTAPIPPAPVASYSGAISVSGTTSIDYNFAITGITDYLGYTYSVCHIAKSDGSVTDLISDTPVPTTGSLSAKNVDVSNFADGNFQLRINLNGTNVQTYTSGPYEAPKAPAYKLNDFSISGTTLRYDFTIDNVNFVANPHTFFIGFSDEYNAFKYAKSAEAITSSKTSGSIDISSYDSGEFELSVDDTTSIRLIYGTATYSVTPTYDGHISVDNSNKTVTYDFTLTNVYNLAHYRYAVTFTPVDPTSGGNTDNLVNETVVPIANYAPAAVSINGYDSGRFTLKVFKDGTASPVLEKYADFVLAPSYTGAIQVNGDKTLDYSFEISDTFSLAGYTYSVTYTPDNPLPAALPNPQDEIAVSTSTVNITGFDISNYETGSFALNLYKDGSSVSGFPKLARYELNPNYSGNLSISGTTLSWSYTLNDVVTFTGFQYELVFSNNESYVCPDPISRRDINSATGSGTVNISTYNNGRFTLNLYKDSTVIYTLYKDYNDEPTPAFTGSYIDISDSGNGPLLSWGYNILNYANLDAYSYRVVFSQDSSTGGQIDVEQIVELATLQTASAGGSKSIADKTKYAYGRFRIDIIRNNQVVFTDYEDYVCEPEYALTATVYQSSRTMYGLIQIQYVRDFSTVNYSYNISHTATVTGTTTNVFASNKPITVWETEEIDLDISSYATGTFKVDLYLDGVKVASSDPANYTQTPSSAVVTASQTNFAINYSYTLTAVDDYSLYKYKAYIPADAMTGAPEVVLLEQNFDSSSNSVSGALDMSAYDRDKGVYFAVFKGSDEIGFTALTYRPVAVRSASLSKNGSNMEYYISVSAGNYTDVLDFDKLEFDIVNSDTGTVILEGGKLNSSGIADDSIDMTTYGDGNYVIRIRDLSLTSPGIVYTSASYYYTVVTVTITLEQDAFTVDLSFSISGISPSEYYEFTYRAYYDPYSGDEFELTNSYQTIYSEGWANSFNLESYETEGHAGYLRVEVYRNGRIVAEQTKLYQYPFEIDFEQVDPTDDLYGYIKVASSIDDIYYVYDIKYSYDGTSNWTTIVPVSASTMLETVGYNYLDTIDYNNLDTGYYKLTIYRAVGAPSAPSTLYEILSKTERYVGAPKATLTLDRVEERGDMYVKVELNNAAYENYSNYKIYYHLNDYPIYSYHEVSLTSKSAVYALNGGYMGFYDYYEVFVGKGSFETYTDSQYPGSILYRWKSGGTIIGSGVFQYYY